ncbi:MAG TPA: hypothetical protein LFW21_05360 [Rickettsia endosymbiont of Pyrocoelia pectoralis]|nr:hypothetical protein [Rickettsia endosymbiont of Pyrocoelia pectoralis]
MLDNPSNIDPKLLAQEVKIMSPLVDRELDNITDVITYGKERLLLLAKDKKVIEALAFMYCFEGSTGHTLNIKELYTNDDLLYNSDISPLAETLDTLTPLIGIFFSQ